MALLRALAGALIALAVVASPAFARHVPPDEAAWALVSAKWNAAWTWHPTAAFDCQSMTSVGNLAGTAQVHGYTGTMWARVRGNRRARLEKPFFTRKEAQTWSYREWDDEGNCVITDTACEKGGSLNNPPTYQRHPRVRATKAGARVRIDRRAFISGAELCNPSNALVLGSVLAKRANPSVLVPWAKFRRRKFARVRYAVTDTAASEGSAGAVTWDVELLYGRGPGFSPDFYAPRRIWPRGAPRHR